MNSSISSSRTLIAVFLAAGAGAFALLLAASEWLVRTKAAPVDTLNKHVALFSRATSGYAAFGDSHVARGFNAAPPVVNLAYPSENIEKMRWKAARFLENNPAPQAVLIQADPHLFAPYRTRAGLDEYPAIFGGTQKGVLALSGRYRPQLVALWQSFLKMGGRLRSTIETTPTGALLSPGNLATWPGGAADRFARNRVALHRPQADFRNAQSATLYKNMVAQFAASGARVCLVSMPTSPLYRAAVEALPQEEKALWDDALLFFQETARAPGVVYLDRRDEYSDLNLFRDPDHLNKAGAIRFGPVLQNTCFGDAIEDARPAAIAQVSP